MPDNALTSFERGPEQGFVVMASSSTPFAMSAITVSRSPRAAAAIRPVSPVRGAFSKTRARSSSSRSNFPQKMNSDIGFSFTGIRVQRSGNLTFLLSGVGIVQHSHAVLARAFDAHFPALVAV